VKRWCASFGPGSATPTSSSPGAITRSPESWTTSSWASSSEAVPTGEGFIALYQGKYGEAATHMRQGNLLDPYIKYQLAVATAGAGDAARAKQLYREVAEYNFNTVGFALVRKDAQQKAGAGTL
jgi:hypothetical protein